MIQEAALSCDTCMGKPWMLARMNGEPVPRLMERARKRGWRRRRRRKLVFDLCPVCEADLKRGDTWRLRPWGK